MTLSVFVNAFGEIIRMGPGNVVEKLGDVPKEHSSVHLYPASNAIGQMNSKECTTCGKEKELGEFYKTQKSQDGHVSSCKQCCQQYYREHYSSINAEQRQMYPIVPKEAAKQLGISERILRRLDKTGEFVAIHTGRGYLRYNKDMLRNFPQITPSIPTQQPEFESPDSGKRIELSRGLYALVSPDDYDFLSQFNWVAIIDSQESGKFYASIPNPKRYSGMTFGSQSMHQIVWRKNGFPSEKCIYHINNNGLDNRQENLTGERPKWFLLRWNKNCNREPRPVCQRTKEQIPIENLHIGRLLTLRNGLVIALDDGDYDRISKFTWHVTDDKYDSRRIKISRAIDNGRKRRFIAQEILDSAYPITYLNGNPFDNRRVNIHTLEIIRRNTDELSAMGIRWIQHGGRYIFRFKTNGRKTYFSSENPEIVLSFVESSKEQIRTGMFFCQKCQRFIDGDNHNGTVCNECYPQTAEGKRKISIEMARIASEQRMSRLKELERIYMEFRDKPCADCKESFPYQIMQAHHVDRTQKKFEIPRLVANIRKRAGLRSEKRIELLISELAKCVNLCPNCHLEREWGVNGSLRIHFRKKYHAANV